MSDLITSFANPAVKRFRALASRKYRRRERAFTLEGLQPVWYAVRSDWRVETLIIAPELLVHEPSQELVRAAQADGTRVIEVSREVFTHLSDRDGPVGLAAIVSGVIGGIEDFPGHQTVGRTDPIVALHEVSNPGNIGTILRSADAAGAAGLLLVGPCGDPLAPSAVKASMGSLFAVPIAQIASASELFLWARSESRPVVAVTGHTSESLWQTTISGNSVLLFGSEGDGLPDEIAADCAAAVAIPMAGTAESLNLATAVSISLFELSRRRHVGAEVSE